MIYIIADGPGIMSLKTEGIERPSKQCQLSEREPQLENKEYASSVWFQTKHKLGNWLEGVTKNASAKLCEGCSCNCVYSALVSLLEIATRRATAWAGQISRFSFWIASIKDAQSLLFKKTFKLCQLLPLKNEVLETLRLETFALRFLEAKFTASDSRWNLKDFEW